MSPVPQSQGVKPSVPSNLYTAVLAVAFGVVLATAAYVAVACLTRYGTIWAIPS